LTGFLAEFLTWILLTGFLRERVEVLMAGIP
jgi:hypothetical protein